MLFKKVKKIRIQHCDPGGIVFTPRYFDLVVEMMEDWFAEALGYPFAQMLGEDQAGTPAMRIDARFHRPSRLGDELEFQLGVRQLRRNTALLEITGFCDGQKRLGVRLLYGYAELASIKKGLSNWPADLHTKMQAYLIKDS